MLDLATRAARRISHWEMPATPRAPAVWTRDDRSLVFARDTGGDEQHDLYRIDVETGAVTRLSEDRTAQEYPIQFSPDNAWLTVMANKRRPEAPDRPGQLNLWKMRADGSE